jgi:hypothetical protein
LLATQDKNIVKRKHALDIASFEWCSSDKALAKVYGPLFFIKKIAKHFRYYQKLLNIFLVCYQRRLLERDFLEAAGES